LGLTSIVLVSAELLIADGFAGVYSSLESGIEDSGSLRFSFGWRDE
jgi:hypothetical protein